MRFLCSISYDGSNFYGFQRQKNKRNVQGEVEKALTKLAKEKILIKGAGRTDKGVHAKDQKIHFDLNININEKGLKKGLNALLPQDIYVNNCQKVSEEFHARFLVKKKIYKYIINLGEYNPLFDKYVYNYCHKLNINKMKKASKFLLGAHSYKSFVSGERDNYNSIIYDIKFKKNKDMLEIIFIGTSFYKYMVRNLVGTLIEVGREYLSINQVKEMVIFGKKYNYTTVPSNGLYLEKIDY